MISVRLPNSQVCEEFQLLVAVCCLKNLEHGAWGDIGIFVAICEKESCDLGLIEFICYDMPFPFF